MDNTNDVGKNLLRKTDPVRDQVREPQILRAQHARRIQRVRWLARLLDDAIRIPGTRWRIGLDGLIGLLPGAGDLVGALVSLYIVQEAARLGVPRRLLARMVWNILLDMGVGAIPFLGDVADLAFKANRRNARLLDEHLGKE